MVITRVIWGPPWPEFGMYLSTILSDIFLHPKDPKYARESRKPYLVCHFVDEDKNLAKGIFYNEMATANTFEAGRFYIIINCAAAGGVLKIYEEAAMVAAPNSLDFDVREPHRHL